MNHDQGTVAMRSAGQENKQHKLAAIMTMLERIEQAIDEETTAIRTDVTFDLTASNERKSRHLYDLARLLKSQGDNLAFLEGSTDLIHRLQEKLKINQATIAAHLEAVTEVAAMIQTAIQTSETDGTYCATQFSQGISA